MMHAALLTLSLIAPFPQVAQEAGAGEPFDATAFGLEVYELLDGLREEQGFSGVMLVVRDGERVLAEGFGMADRENERPWTTRTHSTVGSISKQFTAAAVLKLEELGKLSVEDPIERFFEDVPEDKRGITLHQLLTHSSGFGGLGMGFGDKDWLGRDAFCGLAFSQPLRFTPGERYEYSNVGYSLLAAIVELVSGMRYELFLRARLFGPAGLEETGFVLPELEPERIAVGYRGERRWGTMLDDMYSEDGPSWVLLGNGGMYSTAEDMLLWLQALSEHRVLSEASVEKLWTPYVDETNGQGGSFYAYGWVVLEGPGGVRMIWHNGDDGMGSFFNDLVWIPDSRAFVFMQTNAYEPFVETIVERVATRLAASVTLPR